MQLLQESALQVSQYRAIAGLRVIAFGNTVHVIDTPVFRITEEHGVVDMSQTIHFPPFDRNRGEVGIVRSTGLFLHNDLFVRVRSVDSMAARTSLYVGAQ